MDQKKRRNSILKKPPGTDDENTTEITTRIKRRISFSGKKSVKEFLAGEEQATIWGTSYEESAECMQINAVENGVVGVNDKRIVLRNRRVVVEAKNSNKRRSKKKVCVADNDKENVFAHTPQVEIESSSDPVSIKTSNKEDSPGKSELMLVKSHVQTARTILDHLDSMNACSTTFDFINYSGAINKTVTIEQSVDVSLDENELQMFKFRVPVSAADVSPNLSLVRDGSSPNIFSSSILMSDDDMKVLKLMKVQMGGLISTGVPLKMIESGEKIAINQSTCTELVPVHNASCVIPQELPKQTSQGKTIASAVDEKSENEVDEVGRSLETKNLKRKTIRAVTNMDESSVCRDRSAKSHTIIMDSEIMDVHSPMRKKPMHKQLDKPMDITAIVTHEHSGPPRRQTIHFESATMDESRNDDVIFCDESVCVRVNDHQTIHFDQNQIHEDTICEENDGPQGEQDNHVAMELSVVDETIAEMPLDESSRVTKKRQSIHGPVDILEESPKKDNESGRPKSTRPKRESIYTPVDIAEDSPKQEKPSQFRRVSVHIPTDIVEDSPKCTREREVLKPNPANSQTIYNTDIVQDDSMLCISGSASAPRSHVPASAALRSTIMAAVDMGCDPQDEERCSKNRQSIYTPSDMIEEDLGHKDTAKHQKSIYASIDMVEDSPKLARTNQSCTKPAGHRSFVRDQKSICAPNEMMDEMSTFKATDICREKSAAQSQNRKSIYTPSDMVEDSPKIQRTNENRKPLAVGGPTHDRKSIYTPSDLLEDSPGVLVTGENIQNRRSIYTPTEMVQDSPIRPPVVQSFKCVAQERKSIYTATNMVDDSPKTAKPSTACKNADARSLSGLVRERKSIYNPTDMIEDSPKVTRQANVQRQPAGLCAPNYRKSIHVPSDVVEDTFNHTEAGKSMSLKRQSIYTCVDMVEDSTKASHTSRNLQRQLSAFDASTNEVLNRQTVFSSTNMRADSPLEETMPKAPLTQSNCQNVGNASRNFAKNTETLMASYSLEMSMPSLVSRQSMYAPADIVEDSPPKMSRSRKPDDTQNVTKSSAVASSFKTSIHQMDCATSPEATNRRTICAPSDILEDSPKSGVRRSIRTPVDIMEDSPKLPEPTKANPIATAPKVIVRHMTLQPGLMGDNAAMRVLKSQQTKAKVIEPVQLNDSTMDVSVVDSAPLPTIRPNFSKLNEQLIRGEVKTFADERKNKKSLFDQLEMVAADGPEFDSFRKKPNALMGFPLKPKKTTFNDYTFELTSKIFDPQRRRGHEYTMEMSSRMNSKVEPIDHEKHSVEPHDNMNLSVQISPIPDEVSRAETEASHGSMGMKGNSKRQTIHFHNENEMDVSISAKPQDAVKSQPNRRTIHFHDHLELDKTSTQTCHTSVAATAFEKNPRTIHFDKDNQIDESGHISNVKVEPIPQDISTMDMSMGDEGLNVEVEQVKENQSRQENLTRQSCIVRASLLDAAPSSTEQRKSASNRQTIYAPAAMLEETMDQNLAKQNDKMDLSTSICPEPLESKCTQRIQAEATSIGRQRRTIHCNDDLELDDTAAECPSLAHISRMSHLTTSRINHAPEIEMSTVAQAEHTHQRISQIPTRLTGRKTIHLNQDLDLDDKTEKVTEILKKPLSRQTIYFQQNDDMDESTVERPGEVKSNNEIHCKEDVSKALPKPRRMTTFEDIPVDVDESPEKTTLRKSSFSRTLNFNEIAKATRKFQSAEQRDSPLFCHNPRLKRCESTTEIDRSLAEYLKAEAAATLYRRSPDNMVMDDVEQSPQSVYYDAEEEQVERKEFLMAEQEDHMLEESGMQPLQKTATMRDIELIDEAAAKQDAPEHDHSDMSFELRGVRANRMNHEFFDKELSVSPDPVQVELPRQLVEHAKARRQTILEPETMMEQSDVESMSPEAPAKPSRAVKCISQPSRKTIHFTNEDAVDESFFDENLSRPAAAMKMQNNRRTVYFNESQNSIEDMDSSLTQNIPESQTLSQTIGRSKAAQSMKEILRESDMLFTQSMLKPHLFETQKATVYFDGRDISLDTVPVADNAKPDENVECTPTKANKSRIPQLIGSAKKLQSMKKSMEFIQQKLPILNCSVQVKDEDAVSQDVDEVSEVLPDETSFTCKPKQLQESFETVEIPRKLVAGEPKQMEESFETVDIPRRATTFQRNDTLYLCQNEVDITNISQKSNYRFEDVPITISDVSTYFAQKPPPSTKQTYSPNTTEALCNLDMNRFPDDTHLPKSSDSEDTAYNFDKFKKRYVELTCDSITSTGCNEDIEKTHLSLVNTLDEHESELVRDTCSELPLAEMPPPRETTEFSTSVCRKCKRHKQGVSQNETTLSSFVLAPLTEYKMDLAALKELSNKPRVSDVAKVWRQNLRESDSFNFSGRSAIDLDDDDTMDNFIASLDKERRMAAQHRQRKEFKQQDSFVHTVRKQLQSKKSNWILNDLLLMQNVLRFTHTRIRTFAIFISFSQKDPRGVEVEFNEMRIVQNTHHSRVWTAFDYALHYQLLVELPFDLSTLCPSSENLFQLLDHVEGVTQDVLKIGKDVLYLVLSSPASLIREPSGGIYIRKYTRTRTAQNEVKRTEFQIEVRNMKRLSYESITQPPLYEFDEKVQLLPTGQDFLRVFLADPLRYMKS